MSETKAWFLFPWFRDLLLRLPRLAELSLGTDLLPWPDATDFCALELEDAWVENIWADEAVNERRDRLAEYAAEEPKIKEGFIEFESEMSWGLPTLRVQIRLVVLEARLLQRLEIPSLTRFNIIAKTVHPKSNQSTWSIDHSDGAYLKEQGIWKSAGWCRDKFLLSSRYVWDPPVEPFSDLEFRVPLNG